MEFEVEGGEEERVSDEGRGAFVFSVEFVKGLLVVLWLGFKPGNAGRGYVVDCRFGVVWECVCVSADDVVFSSEVVEPEEDASVISVMKKALDVGSVEKAIAIE